MSHFAVSHSNKDFEGFFREPFVKDNSAFAAEQLNRVQGFGDV